MNDLLRIRSLSKHYDGFDLRNVDLTVPAGSVVGFIGSNGAGKTTTIKAILGLIYPDAGSIELLGQNVGEHAGSKAIKDAKQRTGVVFDTCSFPEEMTVASVGKLMSYSYDSWSPADFEQRLAQFQLPKSKTVKDLSRGMSMKLSLACALAHDPDLLILDEATAGLDPLAREEALDILRGYMRDERHGTVCCAQDCTNQRDEVIQNKLCVSCTAQQKRAYIDADGVVRSETLPESPHRRGSSKKAESGQKETFRSPALCSACSVCVSRAVMRSNAVRSRSRALLRRSFGSIEQPSSMLPPA